MLENRWFSQIVLAAGVMFISVTASFAGMIVDSQGFEAPTYSVGALQGSNSWKIPPGSGGTAMVESTVVASGSQAVQVNRAANSDARWLVPVSGYPQQPNKIIQISWDMKVLQNPSTAFNTFGPFFGVEAYDGPKDSPALLFGSLGVDAKTLDVLYLKKETAKTPEALTATGTKVGLGWNHFSISPRFYELSVQCVPQLQLHAVGDRRVRGWILNFLHGCRHLGLGCWGRYYFAGVYRNSLLRQLSGCVPVYRFGHLESLEQQILERKR
ncbi:MAG: hypothetical protein WCJ35_19945 [Planctomycetota bacterium]